MVLLEPLQVFLETNKKSHSMLPHLKLWSKAATASFWPAGERRRAETLTTQCQGSAWVVHTEPAIPSQCNFHENNIRVDCTKYIYSNKNLFYIKSSLSCKDFFLLFEICLLLLSPAIKVQIVNYSNLQFVIDVLQWLLTTFRMANSNFPCWWDAESDAKCLKNMTWNKEQKWKLIFLLPQYDFTSLALRGDFIPCGL